MSLNKDQIQKVMLGLIMMGGLVYVFVEFMLRPLGVTRDAAVKSAAVLHPQIMEARAQIARVKGLELDGPNARKITAQVMEMIPEGSPVAWFPPRVSEFCRMHGMARVTTRMNGESQDKKFPDFRKLNWGIEIPSADFVPFAWAVAELENEEPLLEIQSISVDASRDDAGTQRVVLNINNLVRL